MNHCVQESTVPKLPLEYSRTKEASSINPASKPTHRIPLINRVFVTNPQFSPIPQCLLSGFAGRRTHLFELQPCSASSLVRRFSRYSLLANLTARDTVLEMILCEQIFTIRVSNMMGRQDGTRQD
jgi:hypothetical protein